MKLLSFGLPLLALLFASGCDDIADRVQDQISAPPQTRTYAADTRTVYAAARTALNQMDYRFIDGGPAEGVLSAASPVMPDEGMGDTRQITLQARFEATPDGGTQVSVWMKEAEEEEDSSHLPSSATSTPLRDTALYQTFFEDIQQALPAAGKR